MNGLLAWALEEIGFKVTRMAGGVMRVVHGDANVGNHLVLRIDLDRPYLADVGFGDGMLEPVPIKEHLFRHDFLDYRLEDLGDRWWRFHNHPLGGAPSRPSRPVRPDPDDARADVPARDPDPARDPAPVVARRSDPPLAMGPELTDGGMPSR